MIDPRREATIQAAAAAMDYNSILLKLEESTDKVLSAIRSDEIEQLDTLIDNRGALCEQFKESARKLEKSLNLAGFGKPNTEPKLNEIISSLNARQSQLLKEQIECETLLTSGLNQCKSEMISLSNSKGLKAAYQESAPARQARFIDSRL